MTKETIRVTDAEIEEAYAQIDPALLGVIRKALVNIRQYHENRSRTAGLQAQQMELCLDRK